MPFMTEAGWEASARAPKRNGTATPAGFLTLPCTCWDTDWIQSVSPSAA